MAIELVVLASGNVKVAVDQEFDPKQLARFIRDLMSAAMAAQQASGKPPPDMPAVLANAVSVLTPDRVAFQMKDHNPTLLLIQVGRSALGFEAGNLVELAQAIVASSAK